MKLFKAGDVVRVEGRVKQGDCVRFETTIVFGGYMVGTAREKINPHIDDVWCVEVGRAGSRELNSGYCFVDESKLKVITLTGACC